MTTLAVVLLSGLCLLLLALLVAGALWVWSVAWPLCFWSRNDVVTRGEP